jgi:site-specific DNA-methyltransferase (adenine-specific)
MIYKGDCLELMPWIADKSIDMILCDLPYGTTACKWDTIIPFEPLWKQYKRLIKDNGAIVLTASQPFMSALVMSNPKMFKYEWIWDKKIPSGMSYARFQPMRQHENVLIFCEGRTPYNPEMIKRDSPIKGG